MFNIQNELKPIAARKEGNQSLNLWHALENGQ